MVSSYTHAKTLSATKHGGAGGVGGVVVGGGSRASLRPNKHREESN